MHELVIKQLIHKAISGNIPALRTYCDRYQIASEKVAQLEAAQAKEAERRSDINNWTDEELEQMLVDVHFSAWLRLRCITDLSKPRIRIAQRSIGLRTHDA
jgi:hypothetical protein